MAVCSSHPSGGGGVCELAGFHICIAGKSTDCARCTVGDDSTCDPSGGGIVLCTAQPCNLVKR